MYCGAKGKDHKQYEYGSKASIASIAQGNLIVDVISHEQTSMTFIRYRKYCVKLKHRAVKPSSKRCVIVVSMANVKSMAPESFYQGKRLNEIHATRKIKSANNAEDVQRLNRLSVT